MSVVGGVHSIISGCDGIRGRPTQAFTGDIGGPVQIVVDTGMRRV